MITLKLTVQHAQTMPEEVLNYLLSRMEPNDAEWLVVVRNKPAALPVAPVAQAPPAAPQQARIVEQTPEGPRVIIPPATTNGPDQMNAPSWMQGAMNPAALAASSINVPQVPSAVPPVASMPAPAAPTGFNSAMFNPVPQPAPAAPVAPAVPAGRNPAHIRDVVFPQIMAAKDVNTVRQIMAQAGIAHISHITEANVNQVAEVIHQVTGVVV